MNFDDLSKQRLDFSVGPRGETIGTMTVTLQDGSVHRWSESVDQKEIDAFAAALAADEVRQRKIEGHYTDEEISGLFDFVGDAVKAVANIGKKIVTSKVFKAVGKGLATISPILGPLGGPVAALGGGMMVASKLVSAATAGEGGAKRSAKKLTKGAVREATRQAPNLKARKTLLTLANRKRKSATKLASRRISTGVPGVSIRRSGYAMRGFEGVRRAAEAAARKKKKKKGGKKPNVVKAAKAGRLRSFKGGNVTEKQLKRAQKRGRVFWVDAA